MPLDIVRPREMAALLFIGFWVLLGVALLFVALRGGPRGARAALQSQRRRSRRGITVAIASALLAFGVVLPVLLLTGNNANASKQYKGIELTEDDREGRDVFATNCSSCHTLKAARAEGKVGPNLDILRPSQELTLDAVKNGRVRGNGTMPARIVTDSDAQAVSSFVSKVAGR